MNRIYFVRHGEGVDNVERKFSFRKTDRPLTERRRLQARETGAYLAGKAVDAVYCSTMLRAHETAQIIAARLGEFAGQAHRLGELQPPERGRTLAHARHPACGRVNEKRRTEP